MDTSEHTATAMKGEYLDDHPRSLLLSLHKMKKSEVMTDVTLMLPDQSAIPCHKVVLMAASPFFETMFQSGLLDCTEQDVQVDFADADTIRTVIEFFYTGIIDVTSENAKLLTSASEFLCCERLKTHLEKYLDGNVGSSNCIELYKLSKLYNLSMLLITAFEFILVHFKEFASMSDFETLTEDDLLEIVSNDGLNVENEDIVFAAVVHWVDADPAELRKEAFSRIAPLIRFPFCTPTTLSEDVCRHHLMFSSGCIELAREALSSPYHYNSRHAIHNARCVPRRAFKGVKKERLIRMVKTEDNICCSITTRDSGRIELEWEEILPNINSTMTRIAVSSTGIYWTDDKCELHCLDVKTKKVVSITWKPPKMGSTVLIINNKITAFGGNKLDMGILPSKSVESFSTEEANPEWKPEPEMLIALANPNVVRFSNKVYVFGGKNARQVHLTQEFDLVSRKWRMRSGMPGPCLVGSAVALNDKVFVIGGWQDVCYSYDPSEDVWEVLTPPSDCKAFHFPYHFTTTTWNGKILRCCDDYVKEYDPSKDTWSLQDHVIPHGVERYRVNLHTVCF